MEFLLVAVDFDNTAAQTFKKSPRNIGVVEASQLALKEIFPSIGNGTFPDVNVDFMRVPSEIIDQILYTDNQDRVLIADAYCFFKKESASLSGFVVEGKGQPLVWHPSRPEQVITELFVRAKLRHFIDQIGEKDKTGTVWPNPCTGFLDFWQSVKQIKDERSLDITTAVISSGHEKFIAKTFAVWDIAQPDILITDDDIRGKDFPEELGARVKPGLLPFNLTYVSWLEKIEQKLNRCLADEEVKRLKGNVIYMGDDLVRDRGMAEGAGVLFGYFNEDYKQQNVKIDYGFQFGDWREPAFILRHPRTRLLLQEGCPLEPLFMPH